MSGSREPPCPTSRDWGAALAAAAPSARLPARAVVAVAHPDDETIALGPLLPRLSQATFVYATDGSPRDLADAHAAGCADREEYAHTRRAELERMFALAGIDAHRARYLQLTDQEAVHALAWLTQRLRQVLEETRAELVITHPYEGGHPDHDATAFAAHAACRLLASGRGRTPPIVEAACYHHRDGRTARGEFLPRASVRTHTRELTEAERELKRRLLGCFASQAGTLEDFPTDRQSFRTAPRYDFTRPSACRSAAVRAARLGHRRPPLATPRACGARGAGPRCRRCEGRRRRRMMLTVLNVAYPLAPAGPDAVGGAEQVLSRIDSALTAAGHRSIVVAAEGSRVSGTLIPTPLPPPPLDGTARALAQERHRLNVAGAVGEHRPDVVHLHGMDFHAYLPPPGVPALVTLHLPPEWYPPSALRGHRPDTWLNCVSPAQRSRCPTDALLLPDVENGISVEALSARHAKRRFVVTLGRICPEKGIHLALGAATRAGWCCYVAGTVYPYPAHEDYFRRAVQPRLGDGHRFLGPVGFARKRRLLTAARALLVPSVAPETSSLVAMEALACGTPVIAFRSGALPDIVEHGRTGFIVGDEAEMAAAIAAISDLDPAACRRAARERFPVERMVARYLDTYRRLARHPEGAPPHVA